MAKTNPNVVPMEPTIEHLHYAVGGVLYSIKQLDEFRLESAAKYGRGINHVTENALVARWGFVRDAYDGFKAHPGTDENVTQRETQEEFDKLRETQRKTPWDDGGSWRLLCFYAKLMGLTGWEEAEAQQPRGGPHG